MISAAPTNLTNIWSQAKNVRADFIQQSHYEPSPSYSYINLFAEEGSASYNSYDYEDTSDSNTEAPNEKIETYDKYSSNSDSEHFIDQDNIERNYRNMYRLLNSNTSDTSDISHSISEKCMKNGALIFVFLNSNPYTKPRRKYLTGLFDQIIREETFKSVLMANQVIKKISPVEKDIATNFFTKLASLIGFQYNFPTSYDHPLDTTNFSINIQNVEGRLTGPSILGSVCPTKYAQKAARRSEDE